jgi:hypothetical protein
MPQSINTLRVGHKYKLINYGEETFFELITIKNRNDYIIKDLGSREVFNLNKLVEYGIGDDYDLFEIRDID